MVRNAGAEARGTMSATMADVPGVMTIALTDSSPPDGEAIAIRTRMTAVAAITTTTMVAVVRDPLAMEDVTRVITVVGALARNVVIRLRRT